MVERHLDPGPQARESSIRMPKRVLRPVESNPFLQNRLEGWNAPHPNVRFPVTFAVYREGPNLALYLTPSGVAPLKEALAIPSRDQAIVLDGSLFGELGKNVAMPWAAIDKLKDEVDLVHLPEGVRLEDPAVQEALARLPVPLLARPEEALPAELGSLVALAVNDGCHAAVLVREPDLLARCFQRFIEEFVVAVRLEDTALPELDCVAPRPAARTAPRRVLVRDAPQALAARLDARVRALRRRGPLGRVPLGVARARAAAGAPAGPGRAVLVGRSR